MKRKLRGFSSKFSSALRAGAIGWVLGFCTLTLFVPLARAVAAQKSSPKTSGITISPASQEIVLKPEQPSAAGSFTVTNNNSSPQTFTFAAVDMGALDETGGLVFSGLTQDYQQKYGLASWVHLSRQQVLVQPGAKAVIDFTIKNKASLSPGGHYGAVIVRRAEDAATQSKSRVALSPQAASLLFLRKVGGERYGLSLDGLSSNHSLWSLPTKAALTFKNDGNVHVVPRGVVHIKDGLGREIAKGIINPESALVLPERRRTLTVTFSSQARVIWPGRYRVEAAYRYDGEEEFMHISQTFYTANLRILLLLLAGIGVVIFAGRLAWQRKLWRRIRLPNIRRNKRRISGG